MQELRANINRPKIFEGELEVFPFDKNSDIQEALGAILDGHLVLILDFYSSGLLLLQELKKSLHFRASSHFKEERKQRKSFRDLSHQIIIEVHHHRLKVKKAPQIGWLKILYPELDYFALSMPDIQGLNSSWQWFHKGLSIPGFNLKIHPWYGVYFPTRFEHLELFDEWLTKKSVHKEFAYDIGAGSGVLSMLLEKRGFKNIIATDLNDNAIIGLEEEIKRNKSQHIHPIHGDLFAEQKEQADLIVFNPPWLKAKGNLENLDSAIYYPTDLFERFFSEASTKLKKEGVLLIIFSNLAKITQHQTHQPIEDELKLHDRFQKIELLKKSVSKGSSKTRRDLRRREKEQVELWVLQLNLRKEDHLLPDQY